MSEHAKPEEFWDAEAVYDEHIAPLMTRIIALCKEHRIPLAATFQYGNDEEDGPLMVTTTIPFPDRESEEIVAIMRRMSPKPVVSFAETISTQPDGSSHISIRRMT